MTFVTTELCCIELFLNKLCCDLFSSDLSGCCIVRFSQRPILSLALSTIQPRTNNQCFHLFNLMRNCAANMFGKLCQISSKNQICRKLGLNACDFTLSLQGLFTKQTNKIYFHFPTLNFSLSLSWKLSLRGCAIALHCAMWPQALVGVTRLMGVIGRPSLPSPDYQNYRPTINYQLSANYQQNIANSQLCRQTSQTGARSRRKNIKAQRWSCW